MDEAARALMEIEITEEDLDPRIHLFGHRRNLREGLQPYHQQKPLFRAAIGHREREEAEKKKASEENLNKDKSVNGRRSSNSRQPSPRIPRFTSQIFNPEIPSFMVPKRKKRQSVHQYKLKSTKSFATSKTDIANLGDIHQSQPSSVKLTPRIIPPATVHTKPLEKPSLLMASKSMHVDPRNPIQLVANPEPSPRPVGSIFSNFNSKIIHGPLAKTIPPRPMATPNQSRAFTTTAFDGRSFVSVKLPSTHKALMQPRPARASPLHSRDSSMTKGQHHSRSTSQGWKVQLSPPVHRPGPQEPSEPSEESGGIEAQIIQDFKRWRRLR